MSYKVITERKKQTEIILNLKHNYRIVLPKQKRKWINKLENSFNAY